MLRASLRRSLARRWSIWRQLSLDSIASIAGIAGLLLLAPVFLVPEVAGPTAFSDGQGRATGPAAGPAIPARTGFAPDVMVGGYGGISYTHPSTVAIVNPGRTDMTVEGVDWIGMPFKSPIYYGLRVVSWGSATPFGAMLDFTHAKAIAPFGDDVSYKGTLNGQPLKPQGKVGDVFKHLEFSHGHNMVTLNAMARLGAIVPFVRPYVGVGGGVSLPHTEIGYRSETGRTYEYQYAGLVAQGLAGLEIPLGRASLFLEYKFSYAPYDVPLSGVANGWLLVTDVWNQLRAWATGVKPPGGHLRTTLATHHGIGGVLVRVGGSAATSP